MKQHNFGYVVCIVKCRTANDENCFWTPVEYLNISQDHFLETGELESSILEDVKSKVGRVAETGSREHSYSAAIYGGEDTKLICPIVQIEQWY
ncbi:hypothetical protein [Vibrio coralliilyticus]|uniref:Uncharacterized protein n=1 Tax=Vibrio coralliilyticus TaxID=190893 RepID=A0AAP6ZVP0_9VIBR|nr:hypothetical protein [Vibrio coralliilyticus]NOI32028.1 hypothetical protein [Vibrio coralliilyticus]NOJ25229.1 hypothetical protein [Vibrio coralliilyticus]